MIKEKNIITFSVYGTDKLYQEGAIQNISKVKEFFPGWICRFYVDKKMNPKFIEKLYSYQNDFVEIHLKDRLDNIDGMFWRFAPVFEENFDILLVRDVDSIITTREKEYVEEWLKSNKRFHIIRDHPYHNSLIMGGMWGVKGNLLHGLKKKFVNWKIYSEKTQDQYFLSKIVYPYIINDAYIQSDFIRYPLENLQKTNIKRIDNEFIGEPINNNRELEKELFANATLFRNKLPDYGIVWKIKYYHKHLSKIIKNIKVRIPMIIEKEIIKILKTKKIFYSQNGEDGLLEFILDKLPSKNNWCVEFGAWDGSHLSNTFYFIKNKKYNSILIEADKEKFSILKENMERYGSYCINAFVDDTESKLDDLLSKTPIPKDFDILSIDIDGDDYFVWDSLKQYKPKVVIIEINQTLGDKAKVINKKGTAGILGKSGTSVLSMNSLASKKGYSLISVIGCNAIYVKKQFIQLFYKNNNSINEQFITTTLLNFEKSNKEITFKQTKGFGFKKKIDWIIDNFTN